MSRRCRRTSSTKTRREMLGWKRTSPTVLNEAENDILSSLSPMPEGQFVTLADGERQIWTISLNTCNKTNTPLVLLHGMGSGVALWSLNLPSLAADRPVYAVDLLGFGRSSRSEFSDDAATAEQEYVDSIEQWRQALGLESMILLGHSFGGFLATAYSLRHADYVQHLILADPWGFSVAPSDEELRERLPRFARIVRPVFNRINPFSPLRLVGPIGPWFMTKIRPDLMSKFEPEVSKQMVANYLYHCNAQHPSGEVAFKTISHNLAWATFPMIERVKDLPKTLTMTFIVGDMSWVKREYLETLKDICGRARVHTHVLEEVGHHVYADRPEEFNKHVNEACRRGTVKPATRPDYNEQDSVMIRGS